MLCRRSSLSWEVIARFRPDLKLVYEQHLEGDNMYKSIRAGVPYNHSDTTDRYGILMARFEKE